VGVERGLSDTEDVLEPQDSPARRRALSDLNSTLLVEAGAGTGKTSLLAGRVTMLLISGVPPEEIAAITFTEAAAGEFSARVYTYVNELLAGSIPEPLESVLPEGRDEEARTRLSRAADRLDGLTATTIHGFCQILLADYAVEADIDPGAQVIDEDTAKAMFDRVFDAWLTQRLSLGAAEDDPVLILTRADPRGVVALFREIADKRREHRAARAAIPDEIVRPDLELIDAVDSLKRWYLSAPAQPFVARLIDELEALAVQFAGSFEREPDFAELWRLAHPDRSPRMHRDGLSLLRPRTENLWRKVAGAEEAPALEEAFQAGFERVDRAYRQLLTVLAASIASKLSEELDQVITDYGAAKRGAAVLDFDDLLHCAVRLLRLHPPVREALAKRFRHLLVDEFQDTDPIQCEIIFRLSGSDAAERWEDVPQRPGALFLVGDPKQSLFLFRGAAIHSYETAKAVIASAFPNNILQVTSNFRSVDEILHHVNKCFEGPLSAPGQPGYFALDPTRRTKRHGLPCAARLTLSLPRDPRLGEIRDAEAEAVAEVCQRLVGGLDLTTSDGATRKVRPGDIALLAPVGVELWRYERALQSRGLPYASKAGRGFYRRQEVQDMICLTRLLADPGDTLALGAFLRGPLVGFTDEALLDATGLLPREGSELPRLSLRTPPDQVTNLELRELLELLRDLRRRVRSTTPSQLLLEAVERLSIRVILSRREPRRASAANANVDLFLQRAAGYSVRGLRRFAQDITSAWSQGSSAAEGRVDAEGEAIDIVSIHGAKGLEWPIVIPINTASSPRSPDQIVHRAEDDTLHWTVGGVVSPGLSVALQAEAENLARERTRLLYVCCTRAKDLLVIPRVPSSRPQAFSQAVDLALDTLPELDLTHVTGAPVRPDRGPSNEQDGALFAAEAERIAAMAQPITWLQPSTHDDDRLSFEDAGEADCCDEVVDIPEIAGAGRVRGLLLHKLIEEVLWEGLAETSDALLARSNELLPDLMSLADHAIPPDCAEVAGKVLATLALPEIKAMRPYLVPEVPVYAVITENDFDRPLAGRIDALAVEEGRITAVIDWKSDVAPDDRQFQKHANQIRLYLAATGAPRGALVYATTGSIRWVAL
jgi:CRISPR-associated exonuclease Cas4